jgi:hypothetical protein
VRLRPAHGVRLLFNQTKQLDSTPNVRAVLVQAFTRRDRNTGKADDRWKTFSQAVRAANPTHDDCGHGRFVNDYFANLLI